MIARLAAVLATPAARYGAKLVSIWVMAFVAASGGIWARRAHKDDYRPRQSWSAWKRRQP